MKLSTTLRAALAVALAAFAGPALAGGTAAVVPVPVPNPVPDYYGQYYLRLDGTYAWSNADRFDTGNELYNQGRRRDDGLSESGRFGFGVGMYMTRWLRGDVTFDTRDEATGYVRDTVTYSDGVSVTANVTDTLTDDIRYRNGVGLANLYVDLPVLPRFTPYVGAGVGVVLHSMSRSLRQNVTCAVSATSTCGGTGGYSIDNQLDDKDYQFALAAAAMAGFSYQVSDNLKADIGYRWLHLDGASFSQWVGTTYAYQPLRIPDQNIQEVRFGLRWDIN
jgi:opacity protein-like surface antigen